MKATKWLVVVLGLAITAGIYAQESKEVTLKGSITCAKCGLKLPGVTKCATVINVKEGKDKGVYFFDKKAHKEYHRGICKAPKPGTVTGKVSENKKKKTKTITVSKLKFD